MMNHMTRQVGPRIRKNVSVDRYLANLETRPSAEPSETARGVMPPGYPQKMQGMNMSSDFMRKVWSARAMKGMRSTAAMSMMGLMTAMRVLPDDLYHRVMETDEDIAKNAIYDEIIRRFGNPADYKKPLMNMRGMDHTNHGK